MKHVSQLTSSYIDDEEQYKPQEKGTLGVVVAKLWSLSSPGMDDEKMNGGRNSQ
jgi:hypothetical protein